MDFKKRIVLTSVLAGVLPAAYLVSRYSTFNSQKVSSAGIKVIGYVLAILTYSTFIFWVDKLLLSSGIFDSNPPYAYGLSLLIILAFQTIGAFIFVFLCERLYGKAFFSSHSYINSRANQAFFVTVVLLGLLITAYLFTRGPFIFIFSSIYFIPNVYIHNKIKQITSTKRVFIPITLLFTLIVLMFPTALFLSNNIEKNSVKIITLIGFHYAPLLLYLILFYISFDIVKLVLIKSNVLAKYTINKGNFKTIIFLIFSTLSLIIVARGTINFNTPKTKEYHVSIPQKSASIQHLKIAMAADFHFSEITNPKFVQKFVREINQLDTDIVLLAGDIFESNKSSAKLDYIKRELKGMKSKYGVYAVEGNHGYYRRTNTEEFFNKSNITLLKDTIITIDNSFQLMGRMDRHNRNRSSIVELLEFAKFDLPIITMDHQPYYDINHLNNIDLYLSGHTHNGQLFPFNLIEKFIYEIPWGYKKIGNTHCFVTCGAQGWGPQVRTASQSEIMLINVQLKEN